LVINAPSKIFWGCFEKIISGEFFSRARITGLEILISFAITLVLGTSLGILLWELKDMGKVLESFVMIFYSVPTILFYPLFAVSLGIGIAPVICVAVIMGVLPIILNIRAGLTDVQPVFLNVARSMNANRRQIFFKVLLPAATPIIFSGIKMGFVFMLVGVLSMEFLIPFDGLGYLVYWGYFIFDTVTLYAGITYIILISVGALYILTLIEKKIKKA
jgi:NitT/TauT family transport system permease protein